MQSMMKHAQYVLVSMANDTESCRRSEVMSSGYGATRKLCSACIIRMAIPTSGKRLRLLDTEITLTAVHPSLVEVSCTPFVEGYYQQSLDNLNLWWLQNELG